MTNLRRIHCVLGGFLALFIAGQLSLFGNLGTYVESYLMARGDLAADSTWFLQTTVGVFFAATSVLMIPAGYVARYIGPAWTASVGMGILLIARVSCFWAVQESVAVTLLTLGIINGMGTGVVLGAPYAAANMHKFTNLGLTYGIITAGQSASGFALNFVITGFLNPHNDSPDIVRSNTRHFSQPEILDRVPYLFLLLSAIYLVLVPAAVTGMRAPPAPPDIDKVTTLTQTTDKNNQVSNKENNEGHTASTESTTTKALSESTQLITKDAVTVERQGPQQEAEEKGVDTKHLFLEKDFYLIWFVAFCGFFVSSSCVGLYKEMGLSRNPDDVYMAALITTGAVCTTLARPVWGIVVDRLGIKRSVMLQGGSCCILTGFWYWALLRGEVIYFLWTILLFVAMSPPKIFIALATKAYFGQLHFFTNFGCVYSSVTVAALSAPLVTSVCIEHVGWPGVTLVLAGVSFASMLTSLLLPGDRS